MLSRSSRARVSTVWSLRPYLNTDTPALSKIWLAHHQAVLSNSQCPVNVWDQCVLSKSYFEARQLVVACDDKNTIVGFVHFGPALDPSEQYLSDTVGMIHRCCVEPGINDGAIASQLLSCAISSLRQDGFETCIAYGTSVESLFYLGVAEGDNLMGVLAADARSVKWLSTAGFQPTTPTECWELELDFFRPPMDRLQIAIRRTCSIGRILDEYHPHWWISSILGHCEQMRFNLVLRSPTRVDCEIMLWYPDSTIQGVDANVVRLRMPQVPEDDDGRERFVCLMAESLRQLQQERKRIVRTFGSASQHHSVRLLQRLGFKSVQQGLVFGRSLL